APDDLFDFQIIHVHYLLMICPCGAAWAAPCRLVTVYHISAGSTSISLPLRWAFCRSAGPEGEGGGFDSPSLPPLDTLPTPKRPGDVPLDPNAEGRSGRLAEKALYCASDVLRIAFSGRHPPCAPIVYARPSGAPGQRSQRNHDLYIHNENNETPFFRAFRAFRWFRCFRDSVGVP